MASEAVFSNRDLVRHLLQQPHTLPVLSASKAIRVEEPCASIWELWRRDGCPPQPVGTDAQCLSSIGGLQSPLCSLVYDMNVVTKTDILTITEVPANSFVDTTSSLSLLDFSMVLDMSNTVLQFNQGTSIQLTVTRDGWRQRGSVCHLTLDEASALLRQILTSTGNVSLPCTSDSSAGMVVHVPRQLAVELKQKNETVLTARRR